MSGPSWLERYSAAVWKLWALLPHRLGSCVLTLAVFVFGVTVKGDWVIIAVHILRHFEGVQKPISPEHLLPVQEPSWRNITPETFHLQGLSNYWILCNSVGFITYFALGGFLHWHFYVRQRDNPETWKCQTNKWLSPELERHSIIFGSFSLATTNTVTSTLACYIANGGWSKVYYSFDHYTWLWYLLQWPVIFIYQDYTTYLLHRLYHTPWLYKHFHKAHHKYVQPTAFSVTAIHPVEIVHMQLTLCLPLFVIPIHWTSFVCIAMYSFHNGIMDHSGIDFKAPWWQPWRPDTIFHDNHHQYFHVNFGFNCFIWDKIHGTYRRPDRIYKEDIFYGKGKPLTEASVQEIEEEVTNRLTENPKAHRDINPFLDQSQVVQDQYKEL